MNVCSTDLPAYVALKNGRLIIHHPPDGPYPVIVLGAGVKLKINDREYKEPDVPIPLTATDNVVITTLTEEIKGSWSLEVSPDNMFAKLIIKPHRRIKYILNDAPPAQVLRLQGLPKEEIFSPVSLPELTHKLQQLGIVHGIDWETITTLIVNPEEKEVIIAKGTPPKPGRDAQIELLFNPEEKVKTEVPEEGKIDLLQLFTYTAVNPGQVLARKHPAQPGKPGKDIKGNILPPPEPRNLLLEAGEGTLLEKGGFEIISLKPGRPVAIYTSKGVQIRIINVLHHKGDVDKRSGHISFTGDIVVGGNVLEGIRVEAGEKIVIEGMVSGATLKAHDSIIIKGNVHTSTIIAGEKFSLLQNSLPLLKRISAQLEELIHALQQLQGKYVGNIGPLVKLLLERKFKAIPPDIQVLKEYIQKLPFEYPLLSQFLEDIQHKLVRLPLSIVKLEEISQLYTQAEELLKNIEAQGGTETGNVTVGYVLNSKIIAAGNVTVTRIGCDNSYIEAGKKVVIQGAFRGGEIKAGEDVYIEELGTRGGAKTIVITGEKATVTIGHAFENSSVKIGLRSYSFSTEQRKIKIRLNPEGELDIIPL